MLKMQNDRTVRWRHLVEASAAGAAMILFALFLHSEWPLVLLAPFGLLVTVLAISHFFATSDLFADTFGLTRLSHKAWLYSALGVLMGAGAAIAYRLNMGWSPVPGTLGRFALLAGMIGLTEGLIYRGYIQGRLRSLGPVAAVTLVALFYSIYKYILFAIPSPPPGTDVAILALITFLGSLIGGAMRELSGSVVPPIAAHVAWDVVVYGELSRAPWWVWS
jgi:membrane protease YdiL (CAAX protease family)